MSIGTSKNMLAHAGLTNTEKAASEPMFFSSGVLVNDKHSKLNPTIVQRCVCPTNHSELVQAINEARLAQEQICVAGGRHAMGGQQFRRAGVLIDMSAMNHVLNFDAATGFVEVEAGALWSDLIGELQRLQQGNDKRWSISQKQTGCDRLGHRRCSGSKCSRSWSHTPPDRR